MDTEYYPAGSVGILRMDSECRFGMEIAGISSATPPVRGQASSTAH